MRWIKNVCPTLEVRHADPHVLKFDNWRSAAPMSTSEGDKITINTSQLPYNSFDQSRVLNGSFRTGEFVCPGLSPLPSQFLNRYICSTRLR
jgi:hypothetical protein